MTDNDSKDFLYNQKVTTAITKEVADSNNPFVAIQQLIHGYDLRDLMLHKSFLDVTYLLIQGKLPSKKESSLLNTLAVALCNPGPRSYPCRAAMVAGVSKSNSGNLLPIGLSVASGHQGGCQEVEKATAFIVNNQQTNATELAKSLLSKFVVSDEEPNIAPGFSSQFGAPHKLICKLALDIHKNHPETRHLAWSLSFSQELENHQLSLNNTGLAAAVMADLGIPGREASAFYQFLIAPGIMAHGLEQTHKPITAIPFVDDEHYEYSQT